MKFWGRYGVYRSKKAVKTIRKISRAGIESIAVPGVALAHQLYIALQAQGHGRDGTHALELALAAMSGIDWMKR